MTNRSWLPIGFVGVFAGAVALAWLIGGAGLPLRSAWRAMPATHVNPAMHSQGAEARPRPTVTIQSSHALPDMPGKKITTVLVEFAPGGFSPAHHHGGSVHAQILSGTIRSQLAGGPPGIYKPGESFFEPLGITHVFAENMSATEPARLLAVFVHDDGAVLTTYHQ